MVCAYLGTGDFLKLVKRNCDIRIRLTPVGCDFQKVQFYIGGDRHILWPGSVMGMQFSELLYELYNLYTENDLRHYHKEKSLPPNTGPYPAPYYRTTSKIVWDEEGRIDEITLTRRHMNPGRHLPDSLDQLEVDLDLPYGRYNYIIAGKDFCYAVAKACTEAIKKYGFMGYAHSSDPEQYSAEKMDINKLLFIKAYALDALEVRAVTKLWEDPNNCESASASSLEKELELLLFDM